ncbi:hypothetical protein ACFUJ0_02350 [Streptomyces sp. NPDC057242]|uniref:hypothetical protein n=1 Tax=unclassified Streptomyces TaxID=2593676 RepID=UPI003643F4D6
MNTTDLLPSRKQPTSGFGATGDHPAGEIRLQSGGGLGRRSRLLRDASAFRSTWTSVTAPVVDEPC